MSVRDSLCMYYAAIVEDGILRVVWTFSLAPQNFQQAKRGRTVVAHRSLSRLCRRLISGCCWHFWRSSGAASGFCCVWNGSAPTTLPPLLQTRPAALASEPLSYRATHAAKESSCLLACPLLMSMLPSQLALFCEATSAGVIYIFSYYGGCFDTEQPCYAIEFWEVTAFA